MDFDDIFDPMEETLVVGDFNLCANLEKGHIIMRYMKNLGFKQIVDQPTHIEGCIIDLVFAYNPDESQGTKIDLKLQSQYFTDIVYVQEVSQHIVIHNSIVLLFLIGLRCCKWSNNRRLNLGSTYVYTFFVSTITNISLHNRFIVLLTRHICASVICDACP